MSRVIVRRRPDGIVQIERRPAWRAVAGPVPVAVLSFLLVLVLGLAGLVAALVRFPVPLLLAGGLVALMLSAARYAFSERRPALQVGASHPRPPLNAA